MFAIPPLERDILYQAVQDLWLECKLSRVLGTSALVIFLYISDRLQYGTGLDHDLLHKVAEVGHHVMSLGPLLSCAWYGVIECLAHLWMVSDCSGGGALLYVSLSSIKSCYLVSICRLSLDMALDLVLA